MEKELQVIRPNPDDFPKLEVVRSFMQLDGARMIPLAALSVIGLATYMGSGYLPYLSTIAVLLVWLAANR